MTGANGLVGSHVCTALVAAGHDVTALVRAGSTPPPGVASARVQLTSESLAPVLADVGALVHCAAVYAYDTDPDLLAHVALDGTRAVMDAAALAGVRRVVQTSSSVTCGSSSTPEPVDEDHHPGPEPAPAYFDVKVRQEELALRLGAELGVQVVVACPSVVLGGPVHRLGPSNALLARYLLDPTRSTYPGGCDVVAAEDVGTAHAVLLERGEPGRRYLVSGTSLTWRELHGLVAELAGVPGPGAEVGPQLSAAVATAAGWWARVSGTGSLLSAEEARTVGRFYWYRHDRLGALGWSPRPARETVAVALSWLLATDHLPRWVRESLRPLPEVHEARPLRPGPPPRAARATER